MMSTTQHLSFSELAENESRVATPVVPSHQPDQHPGSSHTTAPGDDSDDIRAFSASLASILDTTLNLNDQGTAHANDSHPHAGPSHSNGHKVLPLPTPSSSKAQSMYVLQDVRGEEAVVDLSDLPPEIASADISIARECGSNYAAEEA
jgi:Gdp/GTP exchange factor required for growth at low temperatures